jgi:hypothetical protein
MNSAKKYYIEFCILNNVKSKKDWDQLYSMLDIIMMVPYPKDPAEHYGDDVWQFISSCIRKASVPTYGHSKYFARAFNIQTKDQWEYFVTNVSDQCKLGFAPDPEIQYQDDWLSWDDFLGSREHLENANLNASDNRIAALA